MFIDKVDIYVRAGNGGNGCVSFRREKYVAKGGPDGGDGGRGGNVVFRVAEGENTLLDYKYRHKFVAKNGGDGSQKKFHGKNGEDGAIAALCQLAGLPQVGCSMTSGAICMDKMLTKIICEHFGIPQADWSYCYAQEIREDAEKAADRLMQNLSYPVFIKPCSAGSSVGIGKAKNRTELLAAIREAARHDFKVVAESFVKGQEVVVAVLGSRFDPTVSMAG